MPQTIADLETRVDELWGPSQFDWVLGRTVRPSVEYTKGEDWRDPKHHIWFFFCGSKKGEHHPESWLHHGYGETITDCLEQMIALGEERLAST